MDQKSSPWIYDMIFPSEIKLKVIIYVDTSGSINPDKYVNVAFDNINVEIPNQNPYGLSIWGKSNPDLGKPEEYIFTAIDPEGDDLYFYIEWENDKCGEWIGPVESEKEIRSSHIWEERDTFNIRFKAIDLHGYESPWMDFKVTTPRLKTYELYHYSNTIFRLFPNLFTIIKRNL